MKKQKRHEENPCKVTTLAHSFPGGHANTRAFLSHGGLNSIYEAMYHGVPVVGVPLFGDHYDTMTRVAAKGMGIMLHWKHMSEDDLYAALTSVITDKRCAGLCLLPSSDCYLQLHANDYPGRSTEMF